MENITKMHVWILKPIQFMQKDEEGFISFNDLCIAYRGNSLDTLKVFVYISKNAAVLGVKTDYCIFIKKIGNDNEGCDFFIKFPENMNFPITDESLIKKEEFLSPIEVDYSIATSEAIKNRTPDYYSSLEFPTLIEHIESTIESADYISKKKDTVQEMIKHIPSSLKKSIELFDDEKLEENKNEWEIGLKEYKESTVNGERRKISIEIYEMIIDIIDTEIKRRKEIKKPNELNDMTITELKEKQKEAVDQCDFELAAEIRDIIKSRKTTS